MRMIARSAAAAAILAFSSGSAWPQPDQQSKDKALVQSATGEATQVYTVLKNKPQQSPQTEASSAAIKRSTDAAAASVREAERARDPDTAARHMGQAMRSANTAAGHARRAVDNETRTPPRSSGGSPAAPSRPSITIGDGLARRQLIEVNAGGSFDGERARPEFRNQGTGTRFFSGPQDIRAYNGQRGEITTGDGRHINVKPLVDALRNVSPGAAAQPFVATGSGQLRLSPEAQRAISQNAGQLHAVGGIALDVTFQRLALAGVPEFRVPGPSVVVQNPVMISLRRLVAAARNYSSTPERWRALPEDIRYPAAIGRINGYILDPKNEDVLILGTRAPRREARIDIDVLSVLVDSVWRRGVTPMVSLDPLPADPAGPQYPRVINVPRDSLVARVMLDADYAMKRIHLGAEKVDAPGFESLAALYAKSPQAEAFAARFWLRPTPLDVDALRVSESGRTVLYEAGVQALTETVRVDGNGIAGTGDINPLHGRSAREFTRIYDRLEASPAIAPRGIYAQLHGIVDIVTLSRLLRASAVEYGVLDELRRLPYVRLTGDRAVPAFYGGLHVRYGQSGGTDLYMSGGVEMRIRPTRLSIDRFDDYVGQTLERAADEFNAGGFHQPLAISFTLPKPRAPANGEAEVAKQAGFRALDAGDAAAAAVHLSDATRKDPTDIEAWIYLGWTEAQRGRKAAADAAVEQAVALGADDFAARLLYFDISLFADPSLDLQTVDPVLRSELGAAYVNRAYSALSRGNAALAIRSADRAVLVQPDNAEALLARALAQYAAAPASAYKDISAAVDIFRRSRAEARTRLSFALAFKTALELDDLPRQLDRKVTDRQLPAFRDELVDRAVAAADQANEAVSLDPSSGLSFATAIRAAAVQILIGQVASAFGRELSIDETAIRRYADDALHRFPGFAPIRQERSILFQISRDLRGAEREIDEAIALNPANARSYLLRANYRALQSNCAGAREDLARARSLRLPLDRNLTAALTAGGCKLLATQ
jgi:Tfp pilus assembly protein PilF